MSFVERFVAILTVLVLAGCKSSVDVQSSDDSPSELAPVISSPTVSVPSEQHFFSNQNTLTIAGLCASGTRIRLSGAEFTETVCRDSAYSFEVTRTVDGNYTFFVSQTNGKSESRPITVLWSRVTSVAPPTVSFPNQDPYLSASLNLTVVGNCQTGNTIILRQDGVGSTECQDSSFSVSFPKFADGDYNIEVVQQDPAGNEASFTFVWQRRQIEVTPEDPQIIADTSQVISVTGGSEDYTFSLSANSSGSTFDDMTQTYTAGTVAGGFDLLDIVDSEGATETVSISVIAAAADHFNFPVDSGVGELAEINEAYSLPLRVLVVDQFNNPVSAFSGVYQQSTGDLGLSQSFAVTSDSSGALTLPIAQGNTAVRNRMSLVSAGTALPDVAGTGRDTVNVDFRGTADNTGGFGLEYDLGFSPEDVIADDFDGDGHVDFIVLNEADPSFSFLKGAGTGLFENQVKETVICTSPKGMTAGDFDGDTQLDLIVICQSPDTYQFYSGNGDGTFAPPVGTAADGLESVYNAVVTGLFNNDAILDLAIISAGSARLAIRFGAGDGSFGAPTFYSTSAFPNQLVVLDIDGTNGDDLAYLIGSTDSVGWVINDGLGGFGAEASLSSGAGPSGLTTANLDDSGGPDLAVVNNVDANVYVFLNNGSGFNFHTDIPVGNSPVGIHAQRIDSDTLPEILVTNAADNTVSILKGIGSGNFTLDTLLNVTSNPLQVTSADVNGDSINDIAVVANGTSKLVITPGQPDGTLGYVSDLGNDPNAIVPADFNNDGFVDQAVVNRGDNEVQVMLGNGRGFFTALGVPALFTAPGPNFITAADINFDGHQDIFISQQDANSVRMYLGTAGVTFATPVDLPTGSQPSSVMVQDFNKDGHLDVVATASGVNRFSFFPGRGDGTFGTRSDFNTGAQPTAISFGDINLDGFTDLLVTNQSGNSVGIHLSNGDGTFQPESTLNTQPGSNGVKVAFLNADPVPDIVVSNELGASISVFIGRGDGTFNAAVNYSAGATPTRLALSDLNNDSYPDVVVGNGINSTITVLFGSPFGDYSVSTIIPVTANVVGVDLADFNNDKKVDILYLDGTSGSSRVLIGR